MNLTDKSPWRSLALLNLCVTGLLLALSYMFAKGAISPRQLGTGLLLLVVCLFVALLFRYRGRQREERNGNALPSADAAKIKGAIRKIRIAIIVLPVLLVAGLWQTRGEPLFPRITGAAINVLMTAWFINILRKAKKAESGR